MRLTFLLVLAVAAAAESSPGFDLPAVPPAWSAAQRAELQRLAAATDAIAALRSEADAALGQPPRALARIVYEGRLASDPERQATVTALGDVSAVRALAYIWLVHGEARHAEAARSLITAWAATYVPTGNPINENKLASLIGAFGIMRTTFTDDARAAVDDWLRRLAEAQMARTSQANWQAKRIKLVALAGAVLGDAALTAWAREAFARQLDTQLFADGTSTDFRERDALSYHCSGLTPLLEVVHLTGDPDWYTHVGTGGGSIAGSVAFVVPYVDGTRVHPEWVHTTVELDRRRAAAGDPHYQPGTPFRPTQALKLLDLAAPFAPELAPLATRIRAETGVPLDWEAVVLAARRVR